MKYYLIGYPLNYSCSPQIHSLFNKKIDYSSRVLKEEELEDFLKRKEFFGINVTIPYKEKVIPYLDYLDENASLIGAVNTIVNKEGKLYGYNTDYLGVKMAFKINQIILKNRSVMILGSGGTYKTIRHLCEQEKVKEIISVSRTKKDGFITYEDIGKYPNVDIIIDTTPVGTFPNVEDQIISLEHFTKLKCVLDMTYNPMNTSLLLEAKRRKIKIINGLAPLVYQAGSAQEIFFNSKIKNRTFNDVYKIMKRENSSITLVGMPGSGKSHIGKELALKLGYKFVDTDDEIEKIEGMSVSEIFSNKGENYFREKEEELAKKLSLEKKLVISTGGGMINNPRIMKYLAYNSKIVCLHRRMSRYLFDGRRPLLKKPDDYLKLKKKREPLYKKYSDFHIDNNVESSMVIERIVSKL